MKKVLLMAGLTLANLAVAQFSSGTVNLSAALMTVKLDTSPTTATITLVGDSNSMLGIGFGNSGMGNGSDGFIYNSSVNRDYTFLGVGATPSADAVQNWTQTSNTVSGNTRTIVATRTLTGGSGDFAIPNSAGTIGISYARTSGGQSLGYHGGSRGYASLTMAPTLGTADIQAEKNTVNLYPNPAKEKIGFKNADRIESVKIYDPTGKIVKTVNVEGNDISITDLAVGKYFLEINLKDGSKSYQQLIKN